MTTDALLGYVNGLSGGFTPHCHMRTSLSVKQCTGNPCACLFICPLLCELSVGVCFSQPDTSVNIYLHCVAFVHAVPCGSCVWYRGGRAPLCHIRQIRWQLQPGTQLQLISVLWTSYTISWGMNTWSILAGIWFKLHKLRSLRSSVVPNLIERRANSKTMRVQLARIHD